MKFIHLVGWAILTAIFIAFFVLVYIGYCLFWPVQTLVINNYSLGNPIHVMTSVVSPGQPLEYELDYCKYSDIPSMVSRTLVDGQVITLVPTDGALPIGCHEVLVKTAVVPETVNPGRYYLNVLVSYQINPFRTERIRYYTDYFQVVNDPEKDTAVAEANSDEYAQVIAQATSTPTILK